MPKLRAPIASPTLREAFALRLQALRVDHGRAVGRPLSQPAFAAMLGIKKATLGSYERGDREPPLLVLARLRRVTGVSLDELLPDVPERNGADDASQASPPKR